MKTCKCTNKEDIMEIRSRIALLIAVLFVLGTGTIAAYQSQPKTVIVTDQGKVTQYETEEMLVGEFLASQEIELNEKDEVSVDIGRTITDEMEIIITRWMPEVTLNLNKKQIKTVTRTYTVEEFLDEQGITLGEKHEVTPELTSPIENGMELVVKTQKTSVERRIADLPYETKIESTSELKPGERKVKVAGMNGRIERDFEVVRYGGDIVEETQIRSLIFEQPRTEIILEGVKNAIVDPNTGRTYEYTKVLNMEATAYTDIPGDRWHGITASGMPTFVGMVAVDRNTIPLGTRLYVEGYGVAHAGDVGGAVKGNIIDLFMTSSQETKAFGRRARKVYVLKDQTLDVRAERSK